MLEGYYINLDQAHARRELVERNIQEIGLHPEIELRRLPGITPTESQIREWSARQPGIPPGHIGAYMSHKECVRRSVLHQQKNHLMVVEDDVHFSQKSKHYIFEALKLLEHREWDLLYTDLIIVRPEEYQALFAMKLLMAKDTFTLLDLSKIWFLGATCYIVNVKSLDKYHKLLTNLSPLKEIFDHSLKDYVHSGQLKAFSTFPFVTTLNAEGARSTIEEKMVQSLEFVPYRTLLWMES